MSMRGSVPRRHPKEKSERPQRVIVRVLKAPVFLWCGDVTAIQGTTGKRMCVYRFPAAGRITKPHLHVGGFSKTLGETEQIIADLWHGEDMIGNIPIVGGSNVIDGLKSVDVGEFEEVALFLRTTLDRDVTLQDVSVSFLFEVKE